jgi:hypothetical protein
MSNEYALAPTHNNVDNLDPIDDIRVSGRPLKSSVQGLGDFIPGLDRQTLDSLHEDMGTASWKWISATMTPAELKYLMDTYLNGQRSGRVTVCTRKNTGVYANFNAGLTFPQTLRNVLGYYEDVEWVFEGGEELVE